MCGRWAFAWGVGVCVGWAFAWVVGFTWRVGGGRSRSWWAFAWGPVAAHGHLLSMGGVPLSVVEAWLWWAGCRCPWGGFSHCPCVLAMRGDVVKVVVNVAHRMGVPCQCFCNRYRRSYPFSMLITFHYLVFVSHDSFLYLSAVVTCDKTSSSIFQTTTTFTLRQE